MNAIVFLGIQGSGKGTQAKLLSELIGYRHINIGELLRAQIQKGSDTGKQVDKITTRGELVSDELVIDMIGAETSQEKKGIIFDGFPRTLAQAVVLLEKYHLLRVYYLDLPEQEAVKRLSARRTCRVCGENYNLLTHPPRSPALCDICPGHLCRRPDDKPIAIRKRIAEFYRQTHNLKDLFEEKNLLLTVSASGGIKEIAETIKRDIQIHLPR
ncbi:MAG: nucleoside monophosphate kinase [Candidatus Cloacimonetes bacterium]|nr:nucleoside monophosphate kinase [Candidatus Cloacimonadota bacterium]